MPFLASSPRSFLAVKLDTWSLLLLGLVLLYILSSVIISETKFRFAKQENGKKALPNLEDT